MNTTRIMRPSLPNFADNNDDGFILAERIWEALGSRSRYNTQLRKLLFILYKHLFGVDLPKVYAMIAKEVGIVRLTFDDTPLEMYPAMVGMIGMIEDRLIRYTLIKEKRLQLLRKNVEWVRIDYTSNFETLNHLRISQYPSKFVCGGILDILLNPVRINSVCSKNQNGKR